MLCVIGPTAAAAAVVPQQAGQPPAEQKEAALNALLSGTVDEVRRRPWRLRVSRHAQAQAAAYEAELRQKGAHRWSSPGTDRAASVPGKAWKIPLQLRRLFAQLQLVDQRAVSTTDLTRAFGEGAAGSARRQASPLMVCRFPFARVV